MPLIWQKSDDTWRPLSPTGFADEAALHDMIEEAPHTLPLSGRPELVILGREVQLGAGYADLIAVERDGRVVVIEIKLQKNPEARRAVVSQVLAYASQLHGLTVEQFEGVLDQHLKRNQWTSVAEAVESTDQTGSFERDTFIESLRANLSDGGFRLVIVLDSAPADLVRVAGYLESVAGKVLVDLVTISTFNVGGNTVMVPERVDPERADDEKLSLPRRPATRGTLSEGVDDFVASIATAPPAEHERLRRLVEWAKTVEKTGVVRLFTFKGISNRWTLLPRFQPEDAGILTLWNENGAAIQLWRSMFEKRAPAFIPKVESKIGRRLGQGSTVREFDEELLSLLAEAHKPG
jgi:hypothetical protein